MRIKGKTPSKPSPEIIVIPRGDNGENDVVFHARMADLTRFKEIVKRPEPPVRTAPGGIKTEDHNDTDFLARLNTYAKQRFQFIFLESLKETEELVWDTIVDSDPTTWANYEKELEEAGFTQYEINRIVQGVMDANSMNEERYTQARERFLRIRAEQAN